MRTQPECLECFLNDIRSAIDLLVMDEDERLKILRHCLRLLAQEFGYKKVPSFYITELHRLLKREAGISLPFAESRRRTNEVGVAIAERIREEAQGLSGLERFRFLASWALAANSLDSRTAGTGYRFRPDDAHAHLASYLAMGIAVDQLDRLYEVARAGPKVLYIHDNVGEIALDKALIQELKALGCPVTSTVRGGPITSDATIEDARIVGLQGASDKIILAGPDTLGISWEEASSELRADLQRAELIIAKGQANYYVLSEHRKEIPGRVFCLFTTKCEPVSRNFGLTGKRMVATFL